jgi:hypothetical protein
MDGYEDEGTAPLMPVIRALYAGYEALKLARAVRQPLDLDLPERKIILSEEGRVTSVAFAERFEAHRPTVLGARLLHVLAARRAARLRVRGRRARRRHVGAADDGDVLALEAVELRRHVGRLKQVGGGQQRRAAAGGAGRRCG